MQLGRHNAEVGYRFLASDSAVRGEMAEDGEVHVSLKMLENVFKSISGPKSDKLWSNSCFIMHDGLMC